MTVLVLSPHRDDAAFSCGIILRHLLKNGAYVSICNICTTSDYAPYLSDAGDDRVRQVTIARAAEDQAFMNALVLDTQVAESQVKLIDLAWRDAPLRRNIATEEVLDQPPVSRAEIDDMIEEMKELPAADVVLAPLALGGHIDHLLVREAARSVFPASDLLFYEDLPYACRMSENEKMAALSTGPAANVQAWSGNFEESVGVKRRYAAYYPSQIAHEVTAEMENYAQGLGGRERFYGHTDAIRKNRTSASYEGERAVKHGGNADESATDISIVMTAFNAEAYVEEAIHSILQQQTSRRWELLFVDDGSTDKTVEIARHFEASLPNRITVLQHPYGGNLGISASRNLGIEHARGPLLAFLDSDDVWLPHHLETQSALLDRMPSVAMVYAAAERWVYFAKPFDEAAARTAYWGENYLPPLVPKGERSGLLPGGQLLHWFLADESKVPCICTVIVRTEVARDVGAFDDSFRGLYDDQAFHAKVVLAHDVYANDVCLARYRQHPDSCCGRGLVTPHEKSNERRRFAAFVNFLLSPSHTSYPDKTNAVAGNTFPSREET